MGTPVRLLAVVGVVSLVGMLPGIVVSWSYQGATGIVKGAADTPLAGVPVFLDRGWSVIERFVTDSAGRFTLPLTRAELGRAVWLICAPGGVPMLGSREWGQIGPTTYEYTALPADGAWLARPAGWAGPIPRECPPTDRPAYRWRYPLEAGMHPERTSVVEPEWPAAGPPR